MNKDELENMSFLKWMLKSGTGRKRAFFALFVTVVFVGCIYALTITEDNLSIGGIVAQILTLAAALASWHSVVVHYKKRML